MNNSFYSITTRAQDKFWTSRLRRMEGTSTHIQDKLSNQRHRARLADAKSDLRGYRVHNAGHLGRDDDNQWDTTDDPIAAWSHGPLRSSGD